MEASHDVPKPAIWLIVLIVGLTQLSETVYTPSLPDIANFLGISHANAEHTLTVFLAGFAMGVLFWGRLSDDWGRKPCALLGIALFGFGCWVCYVADTFPLFMLGRLIQGIGSSSGSVLGQAMSRDAFRGAELARSYAAVGVALPLFPAMGPFIGGMIVHHAHWRWIFIFLLLVSCALISIVGVKLAETAPRFSQKEGLWHVARTLVRSDHVLRYAALVALSNGILFSFFSEGPFYLISILGVDPSEYGQLLALAALAAMIGAWCVRWWQHRGVLPEMIILYGIWCKISAALALGCCAWLHHVSMIQNGTAILLTVCCHMALMFGFATITSQALALALIHQRRSVGTASSIFGFLYYVMTSTFVFLMGTFHNGTLFVMPLYFSVMGCTMWIIHRKSLTRAIEKRENEEQVSS